MFDALRIIGAWMHRNCVEPEDYVLVFVARNVRAKHMLETAIRADPAVLDLIKFSPRTPRGMDPADFKYHGMRVMVKETKNAD